MTLRIHSSSQSIADLEIYVKDLFVKYELEHNLYPNILISLTEAVNNAIKHGNRSDHSKVVYIETRRCYDRVCCIITDEGKGFDYKSLPDPTMPDNIEKIGGRGVFLMQQLSDHIKFLNNGSTVEMEFMI
jgi:anti-sigma regulatory factor (Ser/Thr protein kinase)